MQKYLKEFTETLENWTDGEDVMYSMTSVVGHLASSNMRGEFAMKVEEAFEKATKLTDKILQ